MSKFVSKPGGGGVGKSPLNVQFNWACVYHTFCFCFVYGTNIAIFFQVKLLLNLWQISSIKWH